MIQPLFQPLHLLLLGGCVTALLLVLAATVVLMKIRSDKADRPAADLGLEDRLQRLTQLKERGLVSDDEYRTKRQQLLNEL